MKGPKAPYVLTAVSIVATLWVTFGLTSEYFGILENGVGLLFGLLLGLAIAQVFVIPKQKMQWERVRLKRKYGADSRRYREVAPPDEEDKPGGWASFFAPRTWHLVNIVLGFGLLLMLFAFGVLNILTAAMGIVTMINLRSAMVTYQVIKRMEADDRQRGPA